MLNYKLVTKSKILTKFLNCLKLIVGITQELKIKSFPMFTKGSGHYQSWEPGRKGFQNLRKTRVTKCRVP